MQRALVAVLFIASYIVIFALVAVFLFFTPDWPQTSNDSFISVLIPSVEFAIAVLAGAVGLAISNISPRQRVKRAAMYLVVIVASFLCLSFVGSLDTMHEFFDAFGVPLLLLLNLLLAVCFIRQALKSRMAAV